MNEVESKQGRGSIANGAPPQNGAGLPLVVIGASAGGVSALLRLGAALPKSFAAPIIVVQHIGAFDGRMPSLMNERSALRTSYVKDLDRIEPGQIKFAPPDHHVIIEGSTLRLVRTAKENFARPAIDPLFRSAAVEWPGPLVGVILTGMLDDGAAGLRWIKRSGGIAVVQDPNDAESPSMPRAALASTAVDYCVPIEAMAPLLTQLAETPIPRQPTGENDATSIEATLAQGKGNAFELLSQIGRSSQFTCPECGGSLWELNERSPRRFRCHTGHAYTERSLEVAQQDASNMAMWSTLRTLQERAALLGGLVESYESADNAEAAAVARDLAKKSQETAEMLRSLLGSLPSSVVGTIPDDPTN